MRQGERRRIASVALVSSPGSPRVYRSARAVRWGAAALAGLLGLVLTAGLVTYDVRQRHDEAENQAMRSSRQYAERLQTELEPLRYLLLGLESFIVTNPDTGPERAERYLTAVVRDWPNVRNVALAPGNVVTTVVPLQGNEVVLGFDYEANPAQWPAVKEAIDSRRSVLAGPIDLVQGGRGLAYRMPVFLDDGSYWGMVSTIRDVDTLLDVPDGMGLPARGPVVLLDGETGALIVGDPAIMDGEVASTTVSVLDRMWTIAVPVQVQASATPMLIAAIGLVSSVALALLTFFVIGGVQRQRALTRLMSDLGQQAPGALYQAREVDGRVISEYVSDGMQELLGLPPGQAVGIEDFMKHVHEDDREALKAAMAESTPGGPRVRFTYRIVMPNGSVRWLRTEAKASSVADGSRVLHGWVSDVTDEVTSTAATRVSASVFAATRDGVIIMDQRGTILEANPAFLTLEGATRESVIGSAFEHLGQGLTAPAVFEEMWSELERHGAWRGEITRMRQDGTPITESVTVTTVRDDAGAVSHYVAVLDNFNIARDDVVTGLPNRRVLEARVRQCIDPVREGLCRAALVSVGLDQFRQVNLAYGHHAGDHLLHEMAIRLNEFLGSDATLVRLRGDEFAFVMEFDDVESLEQRIASVLRLIAEPMNMGERRIQITACAGVTLVGDDGDSTVNLLLHADQALRAAKALGPGRHCYFAASMETEVAERAALVADLRRAIIEEQVDLHFQPIVDLVDLRMVKIESLMRWHHPEQGFVSPDIFIGVAEQHGMVSDLTNLAFDRTVSALVELRRVDPELLATINLSPIELREPKELHERRVQAVLDAGLPPDALVIEITEGALVSPDPVSAANMAVYRDAGMPFAIDDFGTGFSSLSYLQQLEVEAIKIDRSFVTGLAVGSNELTLCQTIIAMARTLGLSVVAEGVETEQQWQLLAAAGCQEGQGFLFAKPMPLPELLTWMRDRTQPG